MYSNYMGFFRSQIKNRYISCQNKGNIFKGKRVYLWKKNNVNEMIESVLYHKVISITNAEIEVLR